MSYTKKYFATLLLLAIFPLQSLADGNEFLEYCTHTEKVLDGGSMGSEEDVYYSGLCMGTIQGVRETMSFMTINNDKINICFPKESISTGQSVRIVNRYLKDNPKELHLNEAFLVMKAYLDAFPCN